MQKKLILAGAEYSRDWFVPRMALAMMADTLTRSADIAAWKFALMRAERLASHIEKNPDSGDMPSECGCEKCGETP